METMNNAKQIFLSYILTPELSAYGNGPRVETELVRSIKRGHTSNNSLLKLPAHYGTHIDFPYHFSATGKTLNDYQAQDFVFQAVEIIEITSQVIADDIIRPTHLMAHAFAEDTKFLIVKTGFSSRRQEDVYWNNNWGFAPECAPFFKEKMPGLRGIGFDTMSLSAYQNRPLGRIAHKRFLIDHDLLIIEDMDLSQISATTQIAQLIAAPLRFDAADGSPVTIIATVYE